MVDQKYRVFEIVFTQDRIGIRYFSDRYSAEAYMKEQKARKRTVHLEIFNEKMERWILVR